MAQNEIASKIILTVFGSLLACNAFMILLLLGALGGIAMYHGLDTDLTTCQEYNCPTVLNGAVYLTSGSLLMQVVYVMNLFMVVLSVVGLYYVNLAPPAAPPQPPPPPRKLARRPYLYHSED